MDRQPADEPEPSEFCPSGTNCVNVRLVNGMVQVSDSDMPGEVLEFDAVAWRAFIEAIASDRLN